MIGRVAHLPPRSPKLNGQVERANRTHTEESPPVRSPSPSSMANSKPGNELTTPSVPIRLWVISLPRSSWLVPHLNERLSSVTNLRDEYILLKSSSV